MSDISVTIRVRNRLPEAAKAIEAALIAAVHDTGERVVVRAKANLYPGHGLRTGELRDSIAYVRDQPKGGTVQVGAHHAGFVELGTIHMAAIPFLRPAMEGVRRDVVEAMNIRGEGGRFIAGLGLR